MLIPDTVAENNPLAGQKNSNKQFSFSFYNLTAIHTALCFIYHGIPVC